MGAIGDATRQAFAEAESDAVVETPRDRTAVDIAIEELGRQVRGLQESAEAIQDRLGPVLGEHDSALDWATLELNRGASPLAQQIMEYADTLGRLVTHWRNLYERIDL